MNWRDGGDLGRLDRVIISNTNEVCTVPVRHDVYSQEGSSHRYAPEPWPPGEANFALILQAPETAKALREIAEGAIVSPGQPPGQIAEQVLRVLRIARESATEYMIYAGKQQQRAERAEAALEEIAALETPQWPSLAEVADIYEQSMKIASAAIAAVKGEGNNEDELV